LHAKTAESVTGTITETDPVFVTSEANNITATDITNLSNLSNVNTGDQDISGITTNTQAIQDTAAQIRADIPANNNQLTNGAGYLTSYTETDPSVPAGTTPGEMQYWDGSEWITVAGGIEGQMLSFVGGVPTWTTVVELTDVYNPTTGKIWMDRNLGASQIATSIVDAAAYGDLYQWGRASDGHECINWTSSTASDGAEQSNETLTLSNSDTPGHGDFILASASPYDWRSPQNDNLWQGVSGTNNPCPSGYRLPTEAEWEAEYTSWSSEDSNGAYDSPLKLPVAGCRHYGDGSLSAMSSFGYYWSSTVSGTRSCFLIFTGSDTNLYSDYRAYGYSVRCFKD
jgi:hypothetical protein